MELLEGLKMFDPCKRHNFGGNKAPVLLNTLGMSASETEIPELKNATHLTSYQQVGKQCNSLSGGGRSFVVDKVSLLYRMLCIYRILPIVQH